MNVKELIKKTVEINSILGSMIRVFMSTEDERLKASIILFLNGQLNVFKLYYDNVLKKEIK